MSRWQITVNQPSCLSLKDKMKASMHISHFVEGKYLSGQRGATGRGKILFAYLLQPTRLKVFFFFLVGEGNTNP